MKTKRQTPGRNRKCIDNLAKLRTGTSSEMQVPLCSGVDLGMLASGKQRTESASVSTTHDMTVQWSCAAVADLMDARVLGTKRWAWSRQTVWNKSKIPK